MGQTRVLQMQDTFLRLCASTALVGALALPSTAQQIINLEEITFSANLTATEIQRSGASVSVLTQDDIRESSATDLTSLLQRLPGISVTQAGGVGSPASLRIRGADARYIATFIDGIRVDDPSGTQTQTDIGQIGLSNIGRIEVLRGSQSALYGGSAVGGVVNITTLRAEEDGLVQNAELEGGSFGTLRAAYGLAYRMDRLELALSASHQRADGHTAFEGTPGGIVYAPDAERDGYEQTRLNAAARYQLTDTVAVGLTGFIQRSETEYDTNERFGFASIDPESDAVAKWRQWGVRGFAEVDLDFGRQEIGVSRYRIERQFIENVSNPDEFIFPSANTFTGRRTVIDWKGVSEIAPQYTLVYGADWEQEEYDQITAFGDLDARTRIRGAFAQLVAAPRDDLDVTVALRQDHHSRFGGFTTGRVSFAWQVLDGVTLRGQIGRGFRAPSNFELFSDFGDEDLGAETSLSYELGADILLTSGGRFSATAFDIRIDDRIDFDNETFRYAQIEATRSRGVELEAMMPITDRIDGALAYTFTHAKITKGPNDGDRVPRVPRHDLTVAATMQVTDDLRGSLSATHVGGRTDGLPSYVTADLGLRYRVNAHADLSLRITNLFDRDYQQIRGYKTPGRAFFLGVASRF